MAKVGKTDRDYVMPAVNADVGVAAMHRCALPRGHASWLAKACARALLHAAEQLEPQLPPAVGWLRSLQVAAHGQVPRERGLARAAGDG